MMKIAGVTMTYNDGYKLKEWIEHYNEYKNELDYYVVVDNGSKKEYVKELERAFTDAEIIKRESNGGCTAAYNSGIRYVLDNTDADAIIIIGNDMKLDANCIHIMYDYLYSDHLLGLISTAVLKKGTTTIESYGHKVIKYNIINLDSGKDLSELEPSRKYTDLVTGGFYMAKRQFYDDVGLQDEKLFMYGDEFDTSIRAKKAGYKAGVTCETYAWHWHINEPNTTERRPASNYLIARNRIYVSKKHFGLQMIIGSFWYYSLRQFIILMIAGIVKRKKNYLIKAKYSLLGGINGLIGNMDKNKYTQF